MPDVTDIVTEFLQFRIHTNQKCRHVVAIPITNEYTVIKLAAYLEDKGFQPTFIESNTIQINLNPNLEEVLSTFYICND